MEVKKEEYKSMVEAATAKSKGLKNTSLAFFVGGFICVIGQLICNLLKY